MDLKKIISGKRKPNKIWVDQVSEFYNYSFKDFLKINNIEMYSTYNEGKSVVAKRFIGTLKNKIFKHMTAISKDVYFHMLDDIVDKYNSTVHRIIKMKPIDVNLFIFTGALKNMLLVLSLILALKQTFTEHINGWSQTN